MSTYIKTFESFNEISVEEGKNFFEVVGSNLKHVIDDQKKLINGVYRNNIDSKSLNVLERKNVKLKDKDIIKILNEDIATRKKRILNKNINKVSEVNVEFKSYFYFIQYLVITLQIDIQKILEENSEIIDIKHGSESFNVFDLGKVEKTDENINKLWKKLLITIKAVGPNVNNINLVKKGTLAYLDEQHERWITFFSNPKWRNFQITKLPKAKVDEQQRENEGAIQKAEIKHSQNQTVDGVTDIPKQTGLTRQVTPAFKSKFNQKAGNNAGSNKMKEFFLKMLLNAENIYGKPFNINSGYRSQEYQEQLQKNPRIKAAKNSPHVQGVAADISLVGENTQKIVDALTKAGFNRMGVGKSFIHVDAGDRVNPRIWVPFARWGYKY